MGCGRPIGDRRVARSGTIRGPVRGVRDTHNNRVRFAAVPLSGGGGWASEPVNVGVLASPR